MRSKKTILWLIIGIVLAVGIAVVVIIGSRWNRPLGPELDMPTVLPSVTYKTPVEMEITKTEQTVVISQSSTETVKPTPTQQPLCGGPEMMYLLGIGADSRSDTYLYGLADVVRVARVDFVTPKITVLSIPRDLWVEIPEIESHYGITQGKLNQAYLYGGPGMGYYDGPGEGPGLLARTLYLNLGLMVDHYGAVNMQTFVKIIDAIGGIDIYLEKDVDGRPIDDKTEDMGYFYAGQNHLMGDAALRLSRIRKKYSDQKRVENQTLVMCAVREKILSPAVLPDLPKIAAAFQGSVQTDLSLSEISKLICLVPQVSKENLVFSSLPKEAMKSGWIYDPNRKKNTYAKEADFDLMRESIADFIDGTWPTESKGSVCP